LGSIYGIGNDTDTNGNLSAGYLSLNSLATNPLLTGSDNVVFSVFGGVDITDGSGNNLMNFRNPVTNTLLYNNNIIVNPFDQNAEISPSAPLRDYGNDNTLMNTARLVGNVNAAYNVGIGSASFASARGPAFIYNTVLGSGSGTSNPGFTPSVQRNNTSVGSQANQQMVSVEGATAFGVLALNSASLASNLQLRTENTAFGFGAGSTTGGDPPGLSASNITTIGFDSGSTANNNTVFIGPQASARNSPQPQGVISSVGVGSQTDVTTSDSVILGNAFNVGNAINTFFISGGNATITGSNNSFTGNGLVTTGNVIGNGNLVNNQTGPHAMYGTNLRHTSIIPRDNLLSIGFGSGVETPEKDDQIYITNSTTSVKLSTLYQSTASGAVSQLLIDPLGEVFRQSSIRATKKNIKNLEEDAIYSRLNVSDLVPRAYRVGDKTGIGFIAEEVENAGFSCLCTYDGRGELTGVNYSMLNVFLLNEVQKLEKEIKLLSVA
jgi:hypothetical protein